MKKINWYEVILHVGVALIFVGFVLGFFACIDQLDRHESIATVISIERLDEQVVRFETTDGNVWEYTFELDEPIDIGDKAELTFKEYEDFDETNDSIVKVKWVE